VYINAHRGGTPRHRLLPVPQGAALVEVARSKIFEVATRRSLLVALLDFRESFGADPQKIVNGLNNIGASAAYRASALPLQGICMCPSP